VQSLIERGLRVGSISTGGLPWAEIDDAADLRFARTCVYPHLVRHAGAWIPHEKLVPAVA
jgi:choline kinase